MASWTARSVVVSEGAIWISCRQTISGYFQWRRHARSDLGFLGLGGWVCFVVVPLLVAVVGWLKNVVMGCWRGRLCWCWWRSGAMPLTFQA